ncbi:MAG: dTMP kinase [Rhodospirillaceae bacterium]|nr:dTMP kinase [Rhodospirillaceae bacterium]
MPRGRFITFEGGEGAGKSTQAQRLGVWLKARNIDVLLTREPGGSPGAEAIRQLLVTGDAGRWNALTETLLHFAARNDHVLRTIEPALADRHWVICDRFVDSTVAYQGYGLGVDRAFIAMLEKSVLGGLRPDLTLFLDLPVETGLARAASRRGGEDRYETMDIAFHERLRHGFHEIAARDPARCVLIDATEDVDAVQRQVIGAVVSRLLAPAR